MLLIDRCFDAFQAKLTELREAESENISRAANVCAEAMLRGGVVHIYDTGHIINSELIQRAGGLAGLTPFNFGLSVSNANRYREKEPKPDAEAELVSLALKQSNIRAGDVLIVGTVSGNSVRPVELAIQARSAGVNVVAVTSLEYSSRLEPKHPSGKRLFEVADIVIDNHAPYGDAMLEVEGLEPKICPASGICAAIAMWAVTMGCAEAILSAGKTPTVYWSANLPDGMERLTRTQNEYGEKGY